MSEAGAKTYPMVSLFTGAGIGDLGFRAAGFDPILMTEIDAARAAIAATNFPEGKVVVGDLWEVKDQVVDLVQAELSSRGTPLFLISCTAPCQGMSKSGRGTLLRNVRLGKRPKLDPRNRLILPALDVISRLRPEWVVFENVSEMADTLIENDDGDLQSILDIVRDRLGPDYVGDAYDLEFADYGIPQRRRRLISVFTRSAQGLRHWEAGSRLVPAQTHALRPTGSLRPWVTVMDAIKSFPSLDAGSKDTARHPDLPFHRVPILDERKYEWVAHAKAGKSAFDNQCGQCGFQGNAVHGATRRDGINQANHDTPILCAQCQSLLPRPHVLDENGQPRIMRGFTSAYKRMVADLPAPALTRNLSYACSDQKLHPEQNRVLSLAEAFAVHTLDRYDVDWSAGNGQVAKDGLIRLVVGESVPPELMELVGHQIVSIEAGDAAGRETGQRQRVLAA